MIVPIDHASMVPFGLYGNQVSYVIDKLKLAGKCEYASGLLYVNPAYADSVAALIKNYPAFSQAVKDYEASLQPPTT